MAGMQFAQYHAHNVGRSCVNKLANYADNYHNLKLQPLTPRIGPGRSHPITGNISYFGSFVVELPLA